MCILMAVALATSVGVAGENGVVINSIDAKISYVTHHHEYESDVGVGAGVGFYNIHDFIGLHFDVLYRGSINTGYDYNDLTYKGHVRFKPSAGNLEPYLGVGWGYRKFWYNWKIR